MDMVSLGCPLDALGAVGLLHWICGGFLVPEVVWLWWGRGGQTRPVCWGQSQGGLGLLLCSLGVTGSMVYRALLCGQRSETSPFLQLSVVPWGGSVILEHQPQPPGTTKQV